MPPLISAVLLAILVGFIVGIGTEVFIGRAKAHKFPGGSLTAGIAAATSTGTGIGFLITGAIFGIIGWIIYRKILPIGSTEQR